MSNNLGLTLVGTGQANPEVAVNDKGAQIDAAITETTDLDLTNNLTATLVQAQRNARLRISTSGVSKTLTLPATKRLYVVQNDGANAVTIAVGATNFSLAVASNSLVYTDGTVNGLKQLSLSNVSGGAGQIPFDLGVFIPGKPAAAAIVLRFTVVRGFTLPINLTGSASTSGAAATGSSTFTIKNNGTSIGTFNYAAAASTATFTFAAAVTFAVNDIITITAPAVQDATLADISLTLLGSQTGTTGPQGIIGNDGRQGIPGRDGNDGDDAQCFPAVGLQGNPGVQGFQGRPGSDGDDGDQGQPGPGWGPQAIAEPAFLKAGAFVAADVPVGQWIVGRDTVGNTTKLYYNNAGVLMAVALA